MPLNSSMKKMWRYVRKERERRDFGDFEDF
jgi:predicted nucleic acid-binding OB-fold protein